MNLIERARRSAAIGHQEAYVLVVLETKQAEASSFAYFQVQAYIMPAIRARKLQSMGIAFCQEKLTP